MYWMRTSVKIIRPNTNNGAHQPSITYPYLMAENPLLPDSPIVAPIPPNPADRYSVFTKLWLTWAALFVAVESVAVYLDRKNHDRVKRTLSSNVRTAFATDSITGIPLAAPYGKLRRLALLFLLAWLAEHLKQQGRV